MDRKGLISKLTLKEKAALCSGSGFWHTKAIEHLQIPSVMLSDGPHGLRKQNMETAQPDINKSVPAVCFPSGAANACSFDRRLIYQMGEALGEECRAENIAVLLGPAVNIKRSPLCGRNFEYFSEDPYLTGELAVNYIKGVQRRGVGTRLNHICSNNQEQRRMTVSANIDERALREIYLAGFESAVKQAHPWTVMCSYNRVNGVYASENRRLLTDILRGEWGFDGLVMSDWGAVNDRAKGIAAGLDLEMPSSGGENDAEIIKAVKKGTLNEKDLDTAVERILSMIDRCYAQSHKENICNREAHHEFARKIESESMVLLKNNDGILPLDRNSKVAFIGKFAESPRYQGGGSSHINAFKVTSALEAVKGVAAVSYAQGFRTADDRIDPVLLEEAVKTAAAADCAVIFAGLPEYMESEGFDRKNMNLPECQNRLIEEVAKAQPNTVVALHNGSPIEMPWIEDVKGVLELYLGGQAVGAATVDVLFGDKNPCGKLAETMPVKLSDNPSFLFFPGEGNCADYREGVFAGYRYYDKKEMPVLFPFGYGLSYTEFEYSELELSTGKIQDTDTLSVAVKVKNIGSRFGKEIVELYIHDSQTDVIRPPRELKGFEKVALNPGEKKTVVFQLDRRAFAYYDTEIEDWRIHSGTFTILIGKSSRNIVLSASVEVTSKIIPAHYFTLNSTIGDLMACERVHPFLSNLMQFYKPDSNADDNSLGEGMAELNQAMYRDMPLRAALSFSGGRITREMLQRLLEQINAR